MAQILCKEGQLNSSKIIVCKVTNKPCTHQQYCYKTHEWEQNGTYKQCKYLEQ